MKIPKKIHYCWFGGAELPELAIRCMASWEKYCPDYEIIRWDEKNSDLESCRFVREAYTAKKWAFVSDYMRLKVVEEHGGIYLDIDVELLKPLDLFLVHQGFMGFEQAKPYCVATGLGFGAVAHHPVIRKLMENYENTPFIKADGSFDMTPCPARDTIVLTSFGLKQNGLEQQIYDLVVYPPEVFSPISLLGEELFTQRTASIHHFNASWVTPEQKHFIEIKSKLTRIFGVKAGGVLSMLYLVKQKGVLYSLHKIKTRLFKSIKSIK
ncbi:glycosyltransferase family 32 protein [Aeromonas dhakensis]|uniref:glycosyltransferase family 32 protein n=1 Tax=Aeromonas dhakensis TaxID=196024 RepID=UPI00191ECBF7|nr:glycosyltransferase [Aeromonas dhakensis]MBL0619513.1 glycosyl transferase [Aeromonas dhakensis]